MSPGEKAVTLLPTSATSPTNSWPTTSGGLMVLAAHASQDSMWMSVPQMPVLRTRMRTSLMPGRGSGTVSSVTPGPGAAFTSASIGPPRLSRPARHYRPEAGASGSPRVVGPVDDGILHAADPLDLAPGPITGFEEHGRLAEHADAGRRAGDHQVAGFERDLPGDEADELRDREQHVRRRAVLHQDRSFGLHAVRRVGRDPPGANGEARGGVDLAGRQEDGPDREEGVAPLRPQPLAIALLALAQRLWRALPVARAHVVRHDIARDVCERVRVRDPAGALADDDPELDLEIERVRPVRADDGIAVAHDRVSELGEQERSLGGRPAAFRDVVAVVEPHAHDLPRPADDRQWPPLLDGDDLGAGLQRSSRRRLELVRPVVGEPEHQRQVEGARDAVATGTQAAALLELGPGEQAAPCEDAEAHFAAAILVRVEPHATTSSPTGSGWTPRSGSPPER